ncbi:MAG: prolipoprotein diacylglyceryl transferase [Candidatus Schekmanbacteria bacterium]|nr:prolipoprotein diacylglyceryl transferase [Candidatus Schekmanbacteria bacterium]
MHPVLISLGFIKIHTYGLLIAMAFLLGFWLMAKQGQKEGIGNTQIIYDLGFYILLGAIVGSRLLYVAIEYRRYLDEPFKIFYIWEGGLVFYGGLIGALILGGWYVKKQHLSFWQMADLAAPSLALGQSLGRLGCFSAGCCYGKLSTGWGVVFTHPESLAPLGVKLHPVQLYSSLADLSVFVILLALQQVKKFPGQLIAYYLIFYSLDRYLIEFWRGDERGGINLGQIVLSTSQFISIFMFIAGLGLLFWKGRDKGHA